MSSMVQITTLNSRKTGEVQLISMRMISELISRRVTSPLLTHGIQTKHKITNLTIHTLQRKASTKMRLSPLSNNELKLQSVTKSLKFPLAATIATNRWTWTENSQEINRLPLTICITQITAKWVPKICPNKVLNNMQNWHTNLTCKINWDKTRKITSLQVSIALIMCSLLR